MTSSLSCQYHLFCAVQTADVDVLGSSDGIAATGTHIFSGGACFGNYWWRGGSVCAGACDSVASILVAVDQNVAQIVIQAELQEAVARACDCPSVLVVMIHDQTMSFSTVTETAVVVGASSGAVLDSQNVIVVVHHLVQQCGTDLFDGTS